MAHFVKAAMVFAKWVFTAKTLAAVVVRTAIMAGLSALSSKLAARNAAKGNTAAAGVEQQRQGGGLVRRSVALGPCVVFGSELALLASGNGDDNRTNWRALAVSDWPCRAGRVWVNGQPLTFAGDINAGWQACDQYRAKNGQPRLWMRFLTGDWNQTVDAELASTGAFGTDDRLRGVAALLIKRQYDADAFPNGPPDGNDLRIEVMDAPVYDWRDNTQSLTDVTTWKPSTNPVVLAEFILCLARAPAQFSPGTTAPIVGPGLVWARRGGRETFRAQLTAYANLCDALVGGVPRYRAALVVRSDQSGEEVMQLLADACGGDWISGPAGGMLVPGHVPAPCRTIPVGEYVAGQPISFDPYEAPDQAVNTLNITGPDLDRAGELDTMTVVDANAVAADGGERAQGLDLSAVPWAEQRWRVGWRKYRLGRLSERRQIPVRARHRDLIPGDVIVAPDATLPTTPVNMSTAWWQVTGAQESVREDGHFVSLSLQRVDASVDGPVPEMGATADFDPPPLAPELAVPVITVAAAPEVAGAAITPRWRITLDEAGVQTRARVMVQGPAATAGAIGSATQTIVDVTRGVPVIVPSGPGWWRWRASGLDAAGRQGPWGSWSSAVQETQEVVSAVAAAVDWPAVRDTDPAQPKPEDGATVGARIGENLLLPDSSVIPVERVDNSQIGIDANGRPTNVGAGLAAVTVDNTRITINGSGALVGIGSGAGTVVSNAAITAATNGFTSALEQSRAEVLAARQSFGTLLASVQDAATRATWTSVVNRPLNLAGLDPTANTTLTNVSSEVVAARGTFGTVGARIAAEETARADADGALAGRATTLEARAVADHQADLLPNGGWLRGRSDWVFTEGLFPSDPFSEGITGRRGLIATATPGAGLQYAYTDIPWHTWREVDLAWTGVAFVWGGGNLAATLAVGVQGIAGGVVTNLAYAPLPGIDNTAIRTLRATGGTGYDTIRLFFELNPPTGANSGVLLLTQKLTVWAGGFPSLDAGPPALVATEARIATEETVRASADSALAGRATTLEAQMSGTSDSGLRARIATEEAVRASADSALAGRATTLEAQMSGASDSGLRARIATEETVRASADSALANRATTLEASVTSDGLVTNPAFVHWPAAQAVPVGWVSGGQSVNRVPNPLTGASAPRIQSPANAATVALQQSLATLPSAGWHVFELDMLVVGSGSVTTGLMYLFYQNGAGQWRDAAALFSNNPPLGQTSTSVTPRAAPYRWRVMVNITEAPASNATIQFFANHSGFGTPVETFVDVYRFSLRPATQAEIDARQAAIDLPVIGARIGAEEAVRASADSALAGRATTLEAQMSGASDSGLRARIATEETVRASADSALANRATTLEARAVADHQADLLPNGGWLRGTSSWVVTGGLANGLLLPEGITGRRGMLVTAPSGSGVNYLYVDIPWPTWRGVDVAWTGIAFVWSGANNGATLRVGIEASGPGRPNEGLLYQTLTGVDDVSVRTGRGTTGNTGFNNVRLYFEFTPGPGGADSGFIILTQRLTVWAGGFPALDAGPPALVATEARIATEETVRASADSALASQITTVSATANGAAGTASSALGVAIDAQGKVNARVGLQLNVNGHITGMFSDNNGTIGTTTFQQDVFRIVSPSGNVVAVFRDAPGGGSIINGAMLRGATVVAASGGRGHPIVTAPLTSTGSDGAVITFSTAYGAVPRIEARQPPANVIAGFGLGAGETFVIEPTAVSASGFTVRAKKLTPGSTGSQSAGAGSNIGGTPAWRSHKPTTADAVGGNYTYKFTVTGDYVFTDVFDSGMGNIFYDYFEAVVEVYVDKGAGWVKLFDYTASGVNERTGGQPASTKNLGLQEVVASNITGVGQHGGHEFGIHATTGAITAFNDVTYLTQTTSSESALQFGGAPYVATFDVFQPT